jgi:photosystem II stability/assembly factor-like uncharacterized protein
MEFWNEQSGIVIGDPLEGRLFVARTFDEGEHWTTVPPSYRPLVDSGEACFASSGTNVRKLSKSEAIIISGGLHSNLFVRNNKIPIPILQGSESTGANSIAVKNKKCWMIAGGDFTRKDDTAKNLCYTKDGGQNWLFPKEGPSGYRSCVEYIHKDRWITCGLNGVDITQDGGQHFSKISDIGFHVCRKAKKGRAVFFAGGGGRIGKLINK